MVLWRFVLWGGMIATFAYAWRWGFWWALLLGFFWPIWLSYRGVSALLERWAP